MEKPKLTPELAEYLFRGLHYLSTPSDSPAIAILRSHLCIETILHDFVGKQLAQPRELEDARLTTHQLVCLARAIDQPGQPQWIWEAVLALNRLRNRVSHDLESHDVNPAGLTKGQEALTKLVASNSRYPVSERVAHLSDFDQAVRAVYVEILEKVHPAASPGDERLESDQV